MIKRGRRWNCRSWSKESQRRASTTCGQRVRINTWIASRASETHWPEKPQNGIIAVIRKNWTNMKAWNQYKIVNLRRPCTCLSYNQTCIDTRIELPFSKLITSLRLEFMVVLTIELHLGGLDDVLVLIQSPFQIDWTFRAILRLPISISLYILYDYLIRFVII